MGRGHPDRAHLVQRHADATLGERPRRFAAGEAAPNDDGPYEAISSGAVSSTITSCAHFRHFRVVSPVVLDLISSIPTKPQFGHGTGTGLFQVE
jgi:hypothetical protein